MKSEKLLFLFLGFLVIFLVYFHKLDDFDQDLGRHLKLGEIIWQTRRVPAVNLFSYTYSDYPTLDHHWSSQVIFYWLQRTFGNSFLGFFNFLMGAVAFGLVYVFLIKRNPLTAFLALPFFLPLLTDRIGVRPEIFANVLMAFLILLAFKRKFFQKVKWFLPLIFIFWANLHLSYLLGLVVAAILLFSQGLKSRRKMFKNGFLLLLILLAVWVTPWGIKGWLKELLILRNYGYGIVENKSWFYLWNYGGFTLVRHLAWGWLRLFLSFFLSKRKPAVAEFCVLLFLGLGSFLMVRNEPFFFYIGLASLALNLEIICKKIKLFKKDEVRALAGLLALIVCLSWFFWQYQKGRWQFGFGELENYRKGVDFFLAENLPGPIFNNFDIGGYLDYRLYPQYQVFVDNRPEAYPASFFAEVYRPMQLSRERWHKEEEKWGFQTIIWAHSDITDWSKIFLARLAQERDWELIYFDSRVVKFKLKVSREEELIEKN